MTMEKIEKAKAAYEKAKEMEMKAWLTIERHKSTLVKKVDKVQKQHGISLEGADLNDLRAFKWPNGQTAANDLYWALCEIEHKAEDITRAKKNLPDRQRITAEAFEKLGRWEKTVEVFAELPPIVLEFAAQYKARCIEWLMEGVELFATAMREADEKTDRNERNKARADVKRMFGGAVQKVAAHYRKEAQQEEAEKIAETNRVGLLKMLAARVSEKCGRVTDAEGLKIGINGEINGHVIGDKGGATIKTILAGGWNIQCLHYRVLVQN